MKDFGCYDFSLPQSPESLPSDGAVRNERWCYAEFEESSPFRRFLFNADGPSIKPELALLIRRDGSLTHASRYLGELTVHRLPNLGVNPMPVPQTPPAGLQRSENLRTRWGHEIHSTLETFSKVDLNRTGPTRKITEGTFEAYVPTSDYPRTAYWWPHAGVPLAAGEFSPLGKYDRYVEAQTGTNPKASEWELKNHSLQNVPWGGHCNGWAASVILYKPVLEPLWEPATQKVYLKSDIDGMYAEASFCVNWAFYGKRYNVSTDDMNDIYPDKFHAVLLYYIANLKKAIPFDHYRDEHVDNNVITGYKMKITKDASDPLVFHVEAAIQAHAYPQERHEKNEVATLYTISYRYDLVTDNQGNVTSGKWTSSNNPDFLWVPLSQAKCGRENPRIDSGKIDEMVATLKKASTQTRNLNFVLNRALAAGEQVDVPIPGGKITGMLTKANAKGGDASADSVTVILEGFSGYPTITANGGDAKYLDWASFLNMKKYFFPINNVSKITLKNNRTDVATTSTHFEIKSIEFLGGDKPAPTDRASNGASFHKE